MESLNCIKMILISNAYTEKRTMLVANRIRPFVISEIDGFTSSSLCFLVLDGEREFAEKDVGESCGLAAAYSVII